MKVIASASALVLLISLGVACGGGSLDAADAVATNEVAVGDNTFESRVIEVPAGTEVTWTWVGKRPHNVTGDGWGSENLTEGVFTHTFTATGTYAYRCTLHGGMTGRVIVTQ